MDERARVLRQVANRVPHEVGAGRAVEPDDVGPHGLEGGERRADVGAEQHAAARIERDRALERHAPAGALEGDARAQDLGFHLEHVLTGLEDQDVGAALDQPLGLLGEHRDQVLEA